MMKSKLGFMTVLLLFVFSTVLAACSNDSGDENTVKEEGDVIVQEILTFGTSGESTSLDPSRVTEGDSLKVSVNIFETLLNINEQDMTIQPALAKEWKETDGGLTYTFELEEGVKFHDETDLNAEAVVKNFERWAKGDTDTFPFYASVFGGFDDEESHVIESVKAEGNYTVVIKLKRPQAQFLEGIAMDMFAIASPTAFEELGDEEFEKNPVGTGPFQFIEWKPDDSITIARFEDYRENGIPKLSKVTFIRIPDNIARLNALLAGDIDLADDINPTDVEIIEMDRSLQVFERPALNADYLENNPLMPLTNSTSLLGGVEHITGFIPQPTGLDLFSNVEFKE